VPTVGFQLLLYFITPVTCSSVDHWLVLYYLYKNDNNKNVKDGEIRKKELNGELRSRRGRDSLQGKEHCTE